MYVDHFEPKKTSFIRSPKAKDSEDIEPLLLT